MEHNKLNLDLTTANHWIEININKAISEYQ